MRFLSVAERELRAAARHKATYRTRWITAAVFFALLVWLLWVFNAFRNRRAAPEVFEVFSVLTFIYCLLIGTARTADSLSSEKREGTLGLLFLTNLNSAEIIAGKLCSNALAAVYALVAIFPMLAMPLLMGGITFAHFGRTVLALLNAILFSMAAGFVASVLCVRQFTAIALATGLAISFGGALMLAAAALDSYGPTKFLAGFVAVFSPLYPLVSADGTRVFGSNHYWKSVVTIALMSLTWLAVVTGRLARTWRDRPKTARTWDRFKFWQRWDQPASGGRVALRRRLLGINPFFWLDGRRRISSPILMSLVFLMIVITVVVTAPLFGRLLRAGTFSPVVGLLFAWLWTGLGIHALVLYYAAMVASQRLAEDKQTGALELVLSTPTTERTISRGLWMAFARRMFFPACAAILVHSYFIWLLANMCVLDPPSRLPSGTTPGQLIWHVFLDQPIGGVRVDWGFHFAFYILLLTLAQLVAVWFTLGWVGRWLGLRMKHPGFTPIASLALVFAPPILVFSLACYLADQWHLDRLPNRQFLPVMMWLAFGIGIGHCLLVSGWAATRLRRDFRTVVMSRYQPPAPWRWRLPSRRAVLRFAAVTAALAGTAVLIVVCFYGYQNWRSRRAWSAFQSVLKQKNESLDVTPLLPGPVPDSANLARTHAFRSLLSKTNVEVARLFDRMKPLDMQINANAYGNNPQTMEWMHQALSPLDDYAYWTATKPRRAAGTNRADDAAAILQGLRRHNDLLRDLAVAAGLAHFQPAGRRDTSAVLRPITEETLALERVHLLFQVRACALLAADRSSEASDDLLTGLRLACLARQIPDAQSTIRVQIMLSRSLQPLWEGLAAHQWNEPQLAGFQHGLAAFNLLADYTNAVRRVVLANIEVWRAFPSATNARTFLEVLDGGNLRESAWALQPRAWWFDHCIQLHQAGQNAIDKVDVATGHVRPTTSWGDLEGLLLDGGSTELIEQSHWWGANPALIAFAQNALNQAQIACALERYHLAKSNQPETLEQLVPAFLDRVPNDVISGRPMIYQRVDAESHVLRGVGPNGTEDRKGNLSSDDWLWAYSTNTTSTVRKPQ